MRTYHYLSRVEGNGVPSSFLAIGWVGLSEVNRQEAISNGERLHDALISRVEIKDDQLNVSHIGHMHCSAGLWTTIGEQCERKKQLLIYTHDACSFCGVSGLWEMLAVDKASLIDETANDGKGWCGDAVISDPPTILRFRLSAHPGVCKLVDARNYGFHEANASLHARERCHSVVRFIEAWVRLIRQLNLGGMRDTAASQAMHGFRKSYLREAILVHNNSAVLQLEREACHPGRTECFRVGKVYGPVYHCDLASCYPALARNVQMPCRLRHVFGKGRTDVLDWLGRGWCAIAAVDLETDRPLYPLNYRAGSGASAEQRTVWPVGCFKTALAGPELEMALRNGHVKEVLSVAYYASGMVFDRWVNTLLDARRTAVAAGDAYLETSIKLLTNSLFGAFARRHWRWVNCPGVAAPFPYGKMLVDLGRGVGRKRVRFIGWLPQVEDGPYEADDSSPAIFAYVTSLARVRMAKLIERAGRKNCIYCATDALWVDQTGFQRLKKAGEIGKGNPGELRLKGVYDWMHIHGIGHYETPKALVACGVPTEVRPDEDGVSVWYKSQTIGEAIWAKMVPENDLLKRTSSPVRPYRHGIVTKSGRVEPLCFWDGKEVR